MDITPSEGAVSVTAEQAVEMAAAEQPVVSPEVDNSTEIVPEGEHVEVSAKDELADNGAVEAQTFSGIQYNGQDIDVEVPAELVQQAVDKGLDVEALAKELYEGEFGFGEETRAKLDEAFGKFFVDSYLKGIQAGNELSIMQASEAARVQAEADAALFAELGLDDEKWQALDEFAGANLSEEQLASFNRVMQSGDKFAMESMISSLNNMYAQANSIEQPQGLNLIEGSASRGADSVGYSYAEYIEAIRNGEPEAEAFKKRELGASKGR